MTLINWTKIHSTVTLLLLNDACYIRHYEIGGNITAVDLLFDDTVKFLMSHYAKPNTWKQRLILPQVPYRGLTVL